jgi:enoyl-CoA hydratase/carnithine racemase
MGGGLEVALACDIRIAESQARLALPETRVGLLPCAGGTQRLARLVGEGWAKRMILCNEHISADTALRIGLVSEVHPADELPARVEEHAARFAHIPANQLALNKLLINQAYENMGLRTTQMLGTFFDGITRHTEEAYRWAESFREKGLREVIRERDAPCGDYGERSREGEGPGEGGTD